MKRSESNGDEEPKTTNVLGEDDSVTRPTWLSQCAGRVGGDQLEDRFPFPANEGRSKLTDHKARSFSLKEQKRKYLKYNLC